MNLIDKLLLAALILLLPVGLIVARIFFVPSSPEPESTGETVDVEKLQTVISDAVKNNQPQTPPPKSFQIQAVTFATESGKLKVTGKAPTEKASIIIASTFIYKPKPDETPKPTDEEDKVKGSSVETISILPQSGGNFVYEVEIPKKQEEHIIELRFDQEAIVKTMRFDLEDKRQLL